MIWPSDDLDYSRIPTETAAKLKRAWNGLLALGYVLAVWAIAWGVVAALTGHRWLVVINAMTLAAGMLVMSAARAWRRKLGP